MGVHDQKTQQSIYEGTACRTTRTENLHSQTSKANIEKHQSSSIKMLLILMHDQLTPFPDEDHPHLCNAIGRPTINFELTLNSYKNWEGVG